MTITPTGTITATPTKTVTPTVTPTETSTLVVVTLDSIAAQDGWVLESGRNSGVGGTMDSAAATFRLGDDTSNRQYRAILSFATAYLPDNAVIISAVIKIKRSGGVGTDPFTILGMLRVDMCGGVFGAAALQLTDFQATATPPIECVIPVSNFNSTPVSDWYSASLPASGRNTINPLPGGTQFRLRFATANNGDSGNDYMNFFSGNNATDQPKLVVTYYVP
jgi:hypothetical protein